MSSKTVNVSKAMKENTDLRISPEVVEETAEVIRNEFIPILTRLLAERAKEDSRKTIQVKDLIFDYIDWWKYLSRDE